MKIKQVTISHPFSSFQLLIESNYCRISKKFATFSLASHTCMHTHTLFIEKKIHNDWERYGVIISSVFTNYRYMWAKTAMVVGPFFLRTEIR